MTRISVWRALGRIVRDQFTRPANPPVEDPETTEEEA